MVQLVRVEGELPAGFAELRASAEAEGYRALSRLQDEWAEAPHRFHCLLAAYCDGELVATGGFTAEPEPAGESAMRIRRFYVRPGARRAGVGRTLLNALLHEALAGVGLVTINASNTLAPAFWTVLGFKTVTGLPWTHELRATYSAA